MAITLPDTLKAFAESRVAAGEHDSLDDYVAGLVAADQEALEAALLQGLASGDAAPLDMAAIREQARRRLASR